MENEVQNSIWVNWSHSCIFWLQSFQTQNDKNNIATVWISRILTTVIVKCIGGGAIKKNCPLQNLYDSCLVVINRQIIEKIIRLPKCNRQMWKWRAFCLCFWPGCLLKVGWDWITMLGALKKQFQFSWDFVPTSLKGKNYVYFAF